MEPRGWRARASPPALCVLPLCSSCRPSLSPACLRLPKISSARRSRRARARTTPLTHRYVVAWQGLSRRRCALFWSWRFSRRRSRRTSHWPRADKSARNPTSKTAKFSLFSRNFRCFALICQFPVCFLPQKVGIWIARPSVDVRRAYVIGPACSGRTSGYRRRVKPP